MTIEESKDKIVSRKVKAEATFYKESKVIVAVGFEDGINDLDFVLWELRKAIDKTSQRKVPKRHSFWHEHSGNCRCIKTCGTCGLVEFECRLRFGRDPHEFNNILNAPICLTCGLSRDRHNLVYGTNNG